MPIQVTSMVEDKPVVESAAKEKASAKDPKHSASVSHESDESIEAPETSEDAGSDSDDAGDEGESGSDGSKQANDQGKKKNPVQKRIDKLTRDKSEAERRAQYWEQEARRQQKPSDKEAAQPNQSNSESKANDEPKPDKFDSYESYMKASVKWEIEQDKKAVEEKRKTETAQVKYQERIGSYREKAQEFAKVHSDYDEVLQAVNAAGIKLPAIVEDVVLDSDLGPELMYELAKDQDECKRICALPAHRIATELGKIEARITKSLDETPAAKTKTSAPAPVRPVGTKNASPIKKTIYDESLSQKEYEAMRREQSKKRK